MNRKITRRQLGQLAIASTTIGVIGYVANKTLAQTPNLSAYTALPNPRDKSNPAGVALKSLNLADPTSQLQNLTFEADLATPELATPIIEIGERLIGLTTLRNGTVILAIGAVNSGKKEESGTRLVLLGKSRQTLNLSGLDKKYALDSVLGLNNGEFIGLVSQNNASAPIRLVDIDIHTGAVTFTNRLKLPSNQRFTHLTQCPNGKIYTTVVAPQGDTSLAHLDLVQNRAIILAPLSFQGMIWESGFSDLACSSAGQIFVLGAPRYEFPNKLYTVNPRNGVMSLLKEMDATKITFPQLT